MHPCNLGGPLQMRLHHHKTRGKKKQNRKGKGRRRRKQMMMMYQWILMKCPLHPLNPHPLPVLLPLCILPPALSLIPHLSEAVPLALPLWLYPNTNSLHSMMLIQSPSGTSYSIISSGKKMKQHGNGVALNGIKESLDTIGSSMRDYVTNCQQHSNSI